MKINTLRRLDIWIGRPICWLLTLAYKIKHIFIKNRREKNIRKILFIKLFGIGSIVLTVPSLNAVRKKYPESQIFFLTFKGNESVLTMTEIIPPQNIVAVRRDSPFHLIYDVVKCLISLKREKVDVVIDLEFFARSTAILSFFIRPKYRIGFYGFHAEGLKRGSFINFPINYNHTLHTSRAFFTLLKPLGIHQKDYDPELPSLQPSKGYENKVRALIKAANRSCASGAVKKWIIINPNTSDLIELRRWPRRHFITLVEMILDKSSDFGVVFIGGKDENSDIVSLCRHLTPGKSGKRVVNLAGLTTIRDLIDLFHFSSLFVTNDSGPAHLAALTDIPSIVFFGPETPALYSPLGNHAVCLYNELDCQPCVTVFNGKHSFCKNNICLQQIEPRLVFKLAMEKIENHHFLT